MSTIRNYIDTAANLVEAGDGVTADGLFVERPGVLVLATDKGVTPEALALFQRLNVNQNQSLENAHAEFIARLTYLSFLNDGVNVEFESKKLHDRLRDAGHTSPYEVAATTPTVLFSGLTVETMIEIVANKYGIGRVCSSRTEAMNCPLFRVPGNEYLQGQVRDLIRESEARFKAWRSKLDPAQLADMTKKDRAEVINMGHIGYKAGYLVASGTPEFWQNKLSRRLNDDPDGVERELRLVLPRVANLLQPHYPTIIQPASSYE